MQLSSAKNPRLQSIRRAAAAGRATEDGLIAAEGPHLIEEAMRGQWPIEQIFVTAAGRERYGHLLRAADCEIVDVSPRAFASTAATESTQEILALVRPREWRWAELSARPEALVVVLDGIQDPGNAGTIVRSAEAFGATGVVFLRGSVRVANGKFLRASAGSIFRLPFLETITAHELISHIQASEWNLYALDPSAGVSLDEIDWRASCALVAGSEGAGVSGEVLSRAERVRIPANVESLNAGVACSIALFQARTQRCRG